MTAKKYECQLCERQFLARNKLARHIRSQHSKSHRCNRDNCKEAFDTFQELRRHYGKAHPTVHSCAQCSFTSPRNADIARHVTVAHVNGCKCPMDGCEAMVAQNRLLRHIRTEHGDGHHANPVNSFLDFACSQCEKRFTGQRSLKRHVTAVHSKKYKPHIREKKYHCTIDGCDKAFAAPTLLTDHLNVHLGDQSHDCPHCDRTFIARARLAVHLRKYHRTSIRDVVDNGPMEKAMEA